MATLATTRESVVTEEKVYEAVRRIIEVADPIKIVAFGSRARGNHRPGSDLDLAVIVDRYDAGVDPRPVWRADLDVRMPIDVLVVGRERYEFMKNSLVSVHHDIAAEGVTLYDRATGSIDQGAVERVAR